MALDRIKLELRWRAALANGAGMFTLADATHPLRIFIGGNTVAEATLTVELNSRPPLIPSFSNLVVEARAKEDGSWLLLLQLRSAAGFSEFVAMCAELIDRSAQGADEQASFREFVKGLDQWRQLFKPIRSEQLTDEQIRGLAAELFCILELFRPERSWAEIIQGWVGPLGAPQDFVLGDGLVVETKSFHPDSTSIRIASLSQLDIPEQQRLALIGVVISRETADSVGALTLPLMCERISTALEGMFDLADEFRLKLRELRFDPNDPVYAEHFFVARSPKAFAVRGDFPRIVRADVRAGVKDAEYFISMSEVDAFEIELDQLRPGREGDPWT